MQDLRDFYLDNEDKHYDGDGKNDELIILRYFSSESEAQIFSAVLTKESIPNFLSNMFMNQLLPFGQGSIAMHIRKIDQDRAKEILHEFDDNQHIDPDNIDIDLEAGTVQLKKTHDELRTPKMWYIILIVFIILVLLIHAFNQPEDGFKFW